MTLTTETIAARVAEHRRKRRVPWWVWRLLQSVVILFVITVLIFVATQAMPGDVASIILGNTATEERIEAVRQQLGLNRPPWEQYITWLGGVVRGDFGTSLVTGREVVDMLGERLRNTLILAGLSLAIVLPGALLLGMLAAVRRDRASDKTILGSSLLFNAVPEFVVGTVLVSLLATTVFQVLPAVSLVRPGQTPTDQPLGLILPVITMSIASLFYLTRLVRASFIDVLDSEFVQNARLKGLAERRILFVHVLPNALAAVIPAATLIVAFTVAGTLVVESLFAYPGIGTLMVTSVGNRDIPVVQALALLFACFYFVFNLIADFLQHDARSASA